MVSKPQPITPDDVLELVRKLEAVLDANKNVARRDVTQMVQEGQDLLQKAPKGKDKPIKKAILELEHLLEKIQAITFGGPEEEQDQKVDQSQTSGGPGSKGPTGP